ncbi:MAG TPA: histidine kinase [Edaphobacter sp.]
MERMGHYSGLCALFRDFRHIRADSEPAIISAMQRAVPSAARYHVALRATGFFIWAFLSLPVFDRSTRKGEPLSGAHWIAWLALFFMFAPAFWISSSPKPREQWVRMCALAVQTGCVLGMTAIYQGYLIGCLLVIISWQVALILPVSAAILWAVTASALWIFYQEPHFHMGWRWSATGAFLGFQAFAIVTAAIARSEAAGREEQARINAELVSTRELLRESSKASERIRIAREFHDVVGHNLTALCLHLEAATHHTPDQAQVIQQKALSAARHLLEEVREVVTGFHESDCIDLRSAFEMLQQNVPRITLHIQLPEDLVVTDSARAHATLRCVQEMTTNTLKHSDATNLWIRIYVQNGAIEIEARDDGSKAQQTRPGIGITSMRDRLEQLGGGLAIDTGQQNGFHLKAWFPLSDGVELQ